MIRRLLILIIYTPILVPIVIGIVLGACDSKLPFAGPAYKPPYDGLASPSSLHAQVLSDTEVLLTWTDNSSMEIDFKIERVNGSDIFIAYLLANSTSYTDTGLKEGLTYTYTAYAVGGAETSPPSVQATITTFRKPALSTTSISNITEVSARSGGQILDVGGTSVVSRGVCWNLTGTPTVNDFRTTDSSGHGNFTSSITGLAPNATYYVRAYATNSTGTGYGNQVSFTTLP